MSDARLRELERAAAVGGTEERARLLVELVRMGALARDRVALAAHLGDEGARVALGDDGPPPVSFEDAWREGRERWRGLSSGSRIWLQKAIELHARRWCEALAGWGQEALVRVALAAARSAAGALPADRPGAEPSRAALAAAEAWLRGEVDAVACAAAGDDAAMAARGELEPAPGAPRATPRAEDRAASRAATAASMAAYAAGSLVLETAAFSAAHALRSASEAWSLTLPEPPVPPERSTPEGIEPPAGIALREAVWSAVREEVIPWALRGSALGLPDAPPRAG